MSNKNDKLTKIFDDWLFLPTEERKKINPFTKMFEQSFKNLPKVKQPKVFN